MKQFSCGDVVPGCRRVLTGESDDEIVAAVLVHARDDHGIDAFPAEVLDQVRSHIRAT